jgi:hypothetical protein
MGIKENALIKWRLLNMDKRNERLFRINSGMGWIGSDSVRVSKPTAVKMYPGDLLLRKARAFHGAPEGTPDICGFTSVTVTLDMVGRRVAIFTGIEVKATGDLRPRQKKVGELIRRMGGIFTVLREVDSGK